MDLTELVTKQRLTPAEIMARTSEINAAILRQSRYVSRPNFTQLHPTDVEQLFDLYDERFFAGGCRQLLGTTPLGFRLSRRMTQAAGKVTRRQSRERITKNVRTEYEITISTTLLFQTFDDIDRSILMSGLPCHDRLEALQRILEHEMIHLIEFLIWTKSSCSAPRFQGITHRLFGHTEHQHQLITPRERALTKYGIRAGSRVEFRLDGQHYTGLVNRVTKRATVLVEDPRGRPYTDGKRYAKFYVPVTMLSPIGD